MKKNLLLPIVLVLSFLFINFNAEYALARKVICVDQDPNDNGFLSNHEGWERQNLKPGDIIMVGGPLDSCLKKVMNGDTLIIIAHGWGNGLGFVWGGMRYRGFGTGDSLHPVPPGFNNLMNVHTKFCSCWSARDPDGKGPDKPLTDKIKDAMGPPTNGNTSEGFVGRAFAGNCVKYRYFSSQTDTGTINTFIRSGNSSWQKCPPVNRNPPVNPNQKTCLQTLLDSLKGGAGKVTVTTITYKPPYNADNPSSASFFDCNSDDYCGCTGVEEIISEEICPGNTYSWAPQTSGIASQLLTLSAVSAKICWAAGVGPTVIRTIDGGSTWESATGTGIAGDVYNIFALDATTAFCTSSPAATNLYKTVDGGLTWTLVFSQAGGFINGIQMISPTEGYAEGDPVGGTWTILKTTDGGDSWARMATEPAQAGGEFGWNNSFIIVDTHIFFGTNNTTVYHSTDLGTSWITGTTTGTLNSYAVHFNSFALGLAGGDAMVSTTNGGLTYLSASSPGISGDINGLEGAGAEWWSIRSGSAVYMSSNHGANWTSVHTQGTAFRDIDLTTESGCLVGWSVGDGGNVAKMSSSPSSNLNLTALIEGFWDGIGNISDTLKVYIRKGTAPYEIIDYDQKVNDGSGFMTLNFSDVQIQNGDSYYIVVTHRNGVETWSKSGGEVWTGADLDYDMTSASTQAFGSNMVLKGGRYCIYSGDDNQDGIVDLSDVVNVLNDANVFTTGYVSSDMDGNNITDLTDVVITLNNSNIFVAKITP